MIEMIENSIKRSLSDNTRNIMMTRLKHVELVATSECNGQENSIEE